MKITTLLLIFGLLPISASSYSQSNFTFKVNNLTIKDVLEKMEQQSQFRFFYNDNFSDLKKIISIDVSDAPVEEVLNILLSSSSVSYKLLDNNLIVIGPVINIQTLKVTGKVIDGATNEPLAGVNVVIEGTTLGVVTDINGFFSLTLPTEKSTLVFSFIGYLTEKVEYDGRLGSLEIKLIADIKSLEEVIVVGFGSQKKINLTGSVSTINSEKLESRPVRSLDQALQGIIPGLNIQTSGLGGELNNKLSFNIRGTGTIGSGSNSSPLVLIDGMEGNLNALNPQDIDNISVLKDAAAASIYGSRAPFGVILITTKKGKTGKVNVNYNNNFRWTTPIRLPKMMDSYTFAMYWNEAAANDGDPAKFSDEIIDRIIKYQKGEITAGTVPDANGSKWQYYTGSNANTDWFKEQYKDYAFAQEHSASVSGGTENVQYYASGNFLDQGGLSRYGNDKFKRYAFTSKLNATLSKIVKLNLGTKFIREDYQKPTHMNDLFYHNIARRWPTVPLYDPNGHFTDPSEDIQLRDGGRSKDVNDYLYTQGQLVITPTKNWSIFAEGNYRATYENYHSDVLPAFGYDVNNNPFPVAVGWNSPGYSYVYEYNEKDDYYNTNIYSNYTINLNNHEIKLMTGFNSELMKYRTIAASRSGLISTSLPTINTATSDSKANEGAYQHWATAGFFGRLNYNFKEKYLLEVNARYDGTSRFTSAKRWNLFPSISLGWNVAKEDFFSSINHIVGLFKLRGSYGELGNQNTSNWYPFYPKVGFGVNNGSWLLNGQQPNTASAPGLVSSLLTWERVTSWNAGLDISILDNRLIASFDYFKRKTFDMVGPAPELPSILGTTVPKINNADMESYGFELEATWQDKIGSLGYSVRVILSDDQQKVTRYPNTTGRVANDTWYNNQKMGEIWGYTTLGIAKTQAEMDAHLSATSQSNLSSRWGAGDIMYKDLNMDGKIDGGKGVLDDMGDRSIIGNSTPRYRYGFDLSSDWKGFDLRIFFQGIGKRDWMPNGPYFWGASGGMWQSAGFTDHIDFFRDENSQFAQKYGVNTNAYYPKPYFNTGKNQQTQTRYLQSAAYLRLKNLQLGYTLPKSLLSRLNISKVRVFISGENLLTITKMSKIFDPETVGLSGWNDGKTYPLAKVFSTGLSVNF